MIHVAEFLISSFIMLAQAVCPNITNFDNGTVTIDLSSATFSCDQFYYLVPSDQDTLLCLESGSWDGAIPRCRVRSCSGENPWPCPDPAKKFCHETTLNSVKVPGCFESECPPPEITAGSVYLSGDTAQITCEENHYMRGSPLLNCITTSNGIVRWDQAYPKCIRYDCRSYPCADGEICEDLGNEFICRKGCPDLAEVEHGNIENYVSYANLTCDEFFYSTHSYRDGDKGQRWEGIACKKDGTWNLKGELSCARHTCQTYKCQETEEWEYFQKLNRTFCYINDKGNPTCAYSCKVPTPKPFLVQDLNIYTYPSNGTFTCSDEYYYLQGHEFVECSVHDGAKWLTPDGEIVSPNSFRCLKHNCDTWTKCSDGQWCEMVLGKPTCFGPCSTPQLTNGVVTVQNQFAEFECDKYYYIEDLKDEPPSFPDFPGFFGFPGMAISLSAARPDKGKANRLERSMTLTCSREGEWEEFPRCVKHTCDTWDCAEKKYCVLEQDVPACWPVCPVPPSIQHGTVDYGNSFAEYTCDSDEYELEGSGTLKCTKNGKWSNSPPICKPRDCDSFECDEDQYCLADENNLPACFPGCPSLTPDSVPSPTHTFSCSEHEYLDGPETLNCGADGEWDDAPAQCIGHTCATWPCGDAEYCLIEAGVPACFPACRNYVMLQNGWIVRGVRTIEFHCKEFFVIDGVSTLTCQKNGQWDNAKPRCKPRGCTDWQCNSGEYCVMRDQPTCLPNCPELTDITNGVVSLSPSLATFSCDSPFFYIPEEQYDTLHCGDNGEWSGNPPECKPHTCETYICAADEYCKMDTFPLFPQCFKACPDLATVPHGTVTQLEETASVFCDDNYYISGTDTLLCEEEGKWNDPLPECKAHTCETLSCTEEQFCHTEDGVATCRLSCPEITELDGYLKVVSRSDTQITYMCPPGAREYILNGHPTINCLSSGEWDNDPPNCREMWCEDVKCADNTEYCFTTDKKCYPKCPKLDLDEGEEGREETEYYFYDSEVRKNKLTATLSCRHFYFLSSDNNQLICQRDGKWNVERIPHCIPHNCSTWDKCEDGREMCVMQEGKPSCVPSGCAEITCAKDEFCKYDIETDKNAVCHKLCPKPEAPDYGSVKVGDTFCKYSCDITHKLQGKSTLKCVDGNWVGTPPTCVPYTCEDWECKQDEYCLFFMSIPVCLKACPRLEDPPHGIVVQNFRFATYICDKFYKMKGEKRVYCQRNGHWDRAAPTCTVHTCKTWSCAEDEYCIVSNSVPSCFKSCPKLRSSGSVDVVQNETTAVFTCSSQYWKLDGPSTLSCNPGGVWSGTEPKCVKQTCKTWGCEKLGKLCEWDRRLPGPSCYTKPPELSAPENGKLVVRGKRHIFNCIHGYVLNGERVLVYDQTKEAWDAPPPTCDPVTCAQWPCPKNYYCIVLGGILTVPMCSVSCPELAPIGNGTVSVVKGTATFSCKDYYFMEGSDTMECVTGQWQGEIPSCKPHSCETFLCAESQYCDMRRNVPTCFDNCPEPELDNGKVQVHNGVGTYSCNQHFYLSGRSRRFCKNGAWQGRDPVCREHTCRTLKCGADTFCVKTDDQPATCFIGCNEVLTIKNGTVRQNLKSASYKCDKNFYLEGNSKSICYNGTWIHEGTSPRCVAHDCSSWNCKRSNYFCQMVDGIPTCKPACDTLESPDEGSVVQHTFTAHFTCNPLYRRVGRNVLHCVEGEWDGEPPTCTLQTCEHFTCTAGFHCEEGEDGAPTCYKDCPTLTVYNGNATQLESYSEITCLQDYKLVGEDKVTCRAGQWDPPPPSCIPTSCDLLETCQEKHSCRLAEGVAICTPDCPVLEFPDGKVAISSFTATFTCNPGFKLRGVSSRLKCRQDGSWDNTPPRCVQTLWEHHQHLVSVCLQSITNVKGCDDVIKNMRKEVDDDVWELNVLLRAVKETEYTSPRHSFIISKLVLREVESSEKILTKELREGTRDIAANNVEFLHSFAKGKIQPGTVKKMTAITIRIINSIIRSIQMTINSKRTDFDSNRWRERGRGNDGPGSDIFTQEPHASFMRSLKLIGETLVGALVFHCAK